MVHMASGVTFAVTAVGTGPHQVNVNDDHPHQKVANSHLHEEEVVNHSLRQLIPLILLVVGGVADGKVLFDGLVMAARADLQLHLMLVPATVSVPVAIIRSLALSVYLIRSFAFPVFIIISRFPLLSLFPLDGKESEFVGSSVNHCILVPSRILVGLV